MNPGLCVSQFNQPGNSRRHLASQRAAKTNVLDFKAKSLGEHFDSFVHSFMKYLLSFYARPCSKYWEYTG